MVDHDFSTEWQLCLSTHLAMPRQTLPEILQAAHAGQIHRAKGAKVVLSCDHAITARLEGPSGDVSGGCADKWKCHSGVVLRAG